MQERLRAAEHAWVAAETRAIEERKRRRLAVVLAASVVLAVGLAGGGGIYLVRQRSARLLATTRAVDESLAGVEVLRARALADPDADVPLWHEATTLARRAADALDTGEADATQRARVDAVHADLEHRRADAERRAADAAGERRLVERCESIREDRGVHLNYIRSDDEYTVAFREAGLDVFALNPRDAGAWIARRRAAAEITAAVDDWAFVRRMRRGLESVSCHHLIAVARHADPEPWRDSLRALMLNDSHNIETLERLAAEKSALAAQPAAGLLLLARVLVLSKMRDKAAELLRRAWAIRPGELWVNYELARSSWDEVDGKYRRPDEAIRHLLTFRLSGSSHFCTRVAKRCSKRGLRTGT